MTEYEENMIFEHINQVLCILLESRKEREKAEQITEKKILLKDNIIYLFCEPARQSEEETEDTKEPDVEAVATEQDQVRDGDIRKEEARMLLEISGVSLDAQPRKDGRWQGRVKEGGSYKYFYGRTEQERNKKIQDYMNARLSTENVKPKKTKKDVYTLHNWLDKWFELYKTDLKALSKLDVQKYIKEIKEILSDKPLGSFNGIEIQEALGQIKTDYMRVRVYKKLVEAFKKAEQLGLVKKNPCVAVNKPKYKPNKKRALTTDEQSILLKGIKGHRFEEPYFLMLVTGMRVSEVLALTAADITPEYVIVNKDVVFVNNERIIQPTKTEAGERKIILPQSAYEMLLPLPEDPNTELYPDITAKYISKQFSLLCKSLQIKGISLHSLRHTYATRLSEAGVPAKVRQYLLGHSSIQVTDNIYTDTQESFILSQKSLLNSLFDTEKK